MAKSYLSSYQIKRNLLTHIAGIPSPKKYFSSKINTFRDLAKNFLPAPICEHAENRDFHFFNGFVVLSAPFFPL